MRKLVFVLVSLALTGCAHNAQQTVQTPVKAKTEAPRSVSLLKSPSSIQLISSADELTRKSFLALGTVSGYSCQDRAQDFPTDMSTVRRQLQVNAVPLHANAVLLNNCVINTQIQGCYRQTLCKGSALRVAQ